jgi:hypothetical protein
MMVNLTFKVEDKDEMIEDEILTHQKTLLSYSNAFASFLSCQFGRLR